MHLKISSAKWRPFCLGLNVLSNITATSMGRDGSQKGNQGMSHYPVSNNVCEHIQRVDATFNIYGPSGTQILDAVFHLAICICIGI